MTIKFSVQKDFFSFKRFIYVFFSDVLELSLHVCKCIALVPGACRDQKRFDPLELVGCEPPGGC